MGNSKTIGKDTRKAFVKLGTCSRTFFYTLNREFGHPLEAEERAADPLAGGLMQQGHQCGMLWGAALAVGAEAYRRNENCVQASAVAITTTQYLMKSFSDRTESVNCSDITGCDWSSKLSVAKYFFSGRFISCFKLAEKWAPEAIVSASEGLSCKPTELTQLPISCASEVANKMGASDEEMVMVAGFAGGLGLSGNACGALSAAIWMNTLALSRKQKLKTTVRNPVAEKTLKAFYAETGNEIRCSEISGQCFKTIDDHAKFIKDGGCDKLINVLAQS